MKDGLVYVAISVVAVIVVMTALNFLWDRKYRPGRIKKGVPTATFASIIKRAVKFLFKEDTTRKVVAPRGYYLISLIATLVFVFLGKFLVAAGIFALFLLIAFGRARQVMYARHKIFTRMFEVANSRLSYGREAATNPWAWVDVQKWEDKTQPGKVIVAFPPRFRVDTPKSREEFQQHFDGVVTMDNAWTYEWKGPEGIVVCEPVPNIPTMAPYPGSYQHPWDHIPLGIGVEGEILWKLNDTPHLLVCGGTGGGKSVLQRNIIFHVIQHSDDIKFLGVDLKRVELKPFAAYKDAVLAIATSLEDGVEVMRYGRDEMERRYAIMEEVGVNHFRNLPEKMPALMIMVDEAFMFMGSEGIKTDEGKERDQLHGEATTIIGAIARLGRAAGVHLVVATQRPDAKVIYGEIKANLSARYVAGRVGSTPSLMILDTDTGTRIPGGVKGRGVIQFDGAEEFIQGYFAEQDWIDKWLLNRDTLDIEPGPSSEISEQPKPGKKKMGMFGRKLNLKNEEDENPIANIPDNEEHEYDGILEQVDPGLEEFEDRLEEERQTGVSRLDVLMEQENMDLDMSVPEEQFQLPANEYQDETPSSMLPPTEEVSQYAPPAININNPDRAPKPQLPAWDDDMEDIFSDLPYNKPSDANDDGGTPKVSPTAPVALPAVSRPTTPQRPSRPVAPPRPNF